MTLLHKTVPMLLACALWAAATPAAQPDASPAAGSGARLDRAIAETRSTLEAANAELVKTRADISAGRMPLTAEYTKLLDKVRQLRERAESARAAGADSAKRRDALTRETANLEEELRFAHSLLSEYRRAFETRRDAAECEALQAGLARVDAALSAAGDFEQLPVAAAEMFALSGQWNMKKLGGMIIEGKCLDAGGTEREGRFAIMGPMTYFASADGSAAGLVATRLGSTRASVYEGTPENARTPVAALAGGAEATVPVDVTGGNALKWQRARETLWVHIKAGGIVMVPIIGVGLVALAMVIMKLFSLRPYRVDPSAAADRIGSLAASGKMDEARAAAAALPAPVGPILVEGLEHRDAGAEYLEEVLHERLASRMPALERFLGALALLGGVAPLLGLLGTVTGMIHTFKLVKTFGSGDPRLLGGGISEALITTEYGLYIAIPVLLAHAFLVRRLRSIVETTESALTAFVDRMKEHNRPGS